MQKEKNKKISFKISIITASIILLSIILAITLYGINYNNRLEITQLKNNSQSQMMGYILKTKENKLIIIDGGTSEDTENLKKYIEDNEGKVDYWFITHPHKDHATAIINIIEQTQIQIDNIYISLNAQEWYDQYGEGRGEEAKALYEALQNEKIKNNVHEVSLNQEIKIDNIRAEILGIKNPEITKNAMNNSSMVIKFYVNNKSIIFLGDTGTESSEKLLKNQKEKLKSNIVQMAHHGQNGATEELYKAIEPQIAMWPTPDWLWNNDNGKGEDTGPWKTKETRMWIEALNIKTNIVQKDGDITIKLY